MRLSSLLGPDIGETIASDPEGFREALQEFHPEDIAELVDELEQQDAVAVMHAMPAALGADVLGRVAGDTQETVLQAIGSESAVALLGAMPPDDRVDVVQRLPEDYAQDVLARLAKADAEAAEEVRELGAWGSDTAGGLMTPDFASLQPDMTVGEAIDRLRALAREGEAETIYSVYVCGYGGKLLGVLSLRDLILSEPAVELEDVMTENVVRVAPTDDQERVADTIARYDLAAVPVVDEQGRMLGVVTVDDVVDVVIEEATEDAQMMGGVVPLEDSYFATGVGEFVWKRAAWLVLLFLGQMLTANVMESNEATLAGTLELAVFIPLIIASGGNAGAQSSSLIIRGLAVGEVKPGDWWRVAVRELGIGIAMGLALGLIGFVRAYLSGSVEASLQVGSSVGISVLAVVTLGTIVGSLLPLGIRRVGMDPAVSSTPFIASLVDVLGLLVYFAVARAILGLVF